MNPIIGGLGLGFRLESKATSFYALGFSIRFAIHHKSLSGFRGLGFYQIRDNSEGALIRFKKKLREDLEYGPGYGGELIQLGPL